MYCIASQHVNQIQRAVPFLWAWFTYTSVALLTSLELLPSYVGIIERWISPLSFVFQVGANMSNIIYCLKDVFCNHHTSTAEPKWVFNTMRHLEELFLAFYIPITLQALGSLNITKEWCRGLCRLLRAKITTWNFWAMLLWNLMWGNEREVSNSPSSNDINGEMFWIMYPKVMWSGG